VFEGRGKDPEEMKLFRSCFSVVLFCPSLAIAANWVFISTSVGGTSYFVDTQSMQKSGHSVTYWEKVNYFDRDEYGNLSSKVQNTINCARREVIRRYSFYYDDTNNQGKITISGPNTNTQWMQIPSESVAESIMKFVF
jgi:uncharacterized FlaG/YvyC family protein